MMKYCACVCALLFCIVYSVSADKPSSSGNRLRFAYDVDFEMNFDNREYSPSKFSGSRTIFGARLTPSVGLDLKESRGGTHSLMFGIDVMKDFGDSPVAASIVTDGNTSELSGSKRNWDLFHEITLYYRYKLTKDKSDIGITAGIFPRRFMRGDYSRAFFSDSLRFYDNNIEGLLFSVTRPASYYEVGCDWMGMFGVDRRERFMIFFAARGELSDMFSLGLAGYLYHFAGARNVSGVVDNALLNPYLEIDLSGNTGLQRFDFTLGWLQSFQNDRRVDKPVFPHAGEFTVALGNWNAGFENYLLYGTDMMPFYNDTDAAGNTYGDLLYMGEPFYKVRMKGSGPGFYDRLELYYEPDISDFLSVRASVVAHFNGWSYSGLQQVVTLKFNLSSLLDRRTSAGKHKKIITDSNNLPGWNI